MRLLGLNQDNVEQLKIEAQYQTFKIVNLENKKIGIEIVNRGEKLVITPEQGLAMYLSKLNRFFENAGIKTKDIVISCPSYFTNTERQSVLDASEVAGFKCIRLINEGTAASMSYGFFKKAEMPEDQDRHVVFVDLGHSKATITVTQFKKNEMKILCSHSDRNIGARNIDNLLVDKFGGEFAKKYGCDPRGNIRARLRMLDGIEKQRKVLSANPETSLSIECLLEDEDLHRNMKRSELEEWMEPWSLQFEALCKEALSKAGIDIAKIHSVEMVGEATRMPMVQQIAKSVFGVESISRTQNSLECIAKGAALQSAMLLPQYSVTNYVVNEYNQHSVSMTYFFKNAQGEETKKATSEIFKVGSNFPNTKVITFDNKKEAFDLTLMYTHP